MSENTQSGYQAYRPGLVMRIWLALGYRYSSYVERPEDDEAIYDVHHIITYWDWRDRLRILISGKTEASICVETETHAKLKGTRSSAAVLAPDARPPH
jgi:hypothetical protein